MAKYFVEEPPLIYLNDPIGQGGKHLIGKEAIVYLRLKNKKEYKSHCTIINVDKVGESKNNLYLVDTGVLKIWVYYSQLELINLNK